MIRYDLGPKKLPTFLVLYPPGIRGHKSLSNIIASGTVEKIVMKSIVNSTVGSCKHKQYNRHAISSSTPEKLDFCQFVHSEKMFYKII